MVGREAAFACSIVLGLVILATDGTGDRAGGSGAQPREAQQTVPGVATSTTEPASTTTLSSLASTAATSLANAVASDDARDTTTRGTTARGTTARATVATRPPSPTAAPVPAPATPPSASGPPLPGSWHLLLADDFSGTSLNTDIWQSCYPWFPDPASGCTNFGNAELEWYEPSQVEVSGGALHLVAAETPTPGQDVNGQPMTYPWTSGIVTTEHDLDFTYGYVQVVARVPQGDGFWPALWLLAESGAWPPEIDVMENYGSDTSKVYLTNHPVGAAQQELMLATGEDLSAGYHTYAVDWEPGMITWYVDGQSEYTVTTGVPSEPMYFIANLAIDNTPGRAHPDASTPSTASFDIKSVQIWQH